MTICANNLCIAQFLYTSGAIPLSLRSSYPPSESPPPYPGGHEEGGEEKVPLSETQFVNGNPEESPQRLQMSPLLSSPGDQSPMTCRAVLSNFNDNGALWYHHRQFENNMQHNKETVNDNSSMQGHQTENFQLGVPSKETHVKTLSNLPSGSGSSTSTRQTSEVNSSPVMSFLQENCGVISDNNFRQNCNNEQRQLYNMVIVGVEPDLTTNL